MAEEVSLQHKEFLNSHKFEILTKMVDYANEHDKNEVPLKIFAGDPNSYNNVQKLRYHALIFKVKRGTWGVSSHAGKWLRGEIKLPKWVVIENNRIIERSSEMVDVWRIAQGSRIVHVTFEYYRDGVPIGIKPMDNDKRQQVLL